MNSWPAVIRESVFLGILVAVVLCLGGCGQEADTDPNPQPVAVTELCSVSFAADGTMTCVCTRTDYHAPPTRSGTQSPPPPAPWMVKP